MAETDSPKELFDQVYGRGLGYYIFNAQSQLRLQQSSFYEKVAILDGGTVALTVTGVIDKIHEQIKHPFALKLGIVCLTVAMLSLFARNLCWTLIESKVMEMKFTNPTFFAALGDIGKIAYPEKLFGFFGLLLTAEGMFFLLYVAVTLFSGQRLSTFRTVHLHNGGSLPDHFHPCELMVARSLAGAQAEVVRNRR